MTRICLLGLASIFFFIRSTVAAPFTRNTRNIFQRDAEICKADSNCIPFTIDLRWGSVDATGAGARGAILINGSFPGPALRLMEGECVDFLVHNNLDVDTGIHFHGIQQVGTPWADGVPGLSQNAIQPSDSYMYRWTADEAGAFFYHAHYKGQIMDGCYGAIQITPKDYSETPFSIIDPAAVEKLQIADSRSEPLLLSDWSKYTFQEFYAIEQAGNIDIACADALIVNGRGSQYCLPQDQITAMTPPPITKKLNTAYTAKGCISANTPQVQGNYTRNLAAIPADVFDVCTPSSSGANYTIAVDSADEYVAMTMTNAGGFAQLKATIDNHNFIVYGYNGRYVSPQTVNQIFVANGDRVSFFVKLNQQVGDYQIRISNSGLNQIISGFAVLSYKGSSGISKTSSPGMSFGGAPLGIFVPFVPAKAAPYKPAELSQTADRTFKFNIQKLPNSADAYRWSLSGSTSYDMSRDDGTPLLYKDPAQIQETDIVKKTKMGEWVDIILQTTGPLAQPHPIHKHANKFFVIGQGTGSFTWASVAEAYAYNASMFNLKAPPYVDGYTTLPGEGTNTWTVLRYKVEIPGAWFLHCHMQTHFSGGMAVALLDGVDQWPTVPSDAGKVCQGNGDSNSTWSPSCTCPASCPGNSDTIVKASSKSSNSTTGSVTDVGSWQNGIWVGSGNLAADPSKTNVASAYTPAPSTGSYGLIKDYTGIASSNRVKLLPALVLVGILLSV